MPLLEILANSTALLNEIEYRFGGEVLNEGYEKCGIFFETKFWCTRELIQSRLLFTDLHRSKQ